MSSTIAPASGFGTLASALRSDFDLGGLLRAIESKEVSEFRIAVRRPDDHLVFDLVFDNLALKTTPTEEPDDPPGPRLVRKNSGAAAYLIVELPPQSFAEEAFLETSSSDEEPKPGEEPMVDEIIPSLPSSKVRMAGPSRLVFTMPPSVTRLGYSLADVLEAMQTWPLSLGACAMPDPEPRFGRFRTEVRDASWLVEAVASAAWRGTRESLRSSLDRAVSGDFDRSMRQAARRIADRTVGGFAGSAQASVGKVMFETMQRELDDLVTRFPALRQGLNHQAGVAALALAVTEALASAAEQVRADVAVSEVPYLQLLIRPHQPPRHATALELPYRLLLSPIEDAHWRHRSDPFAQAGRIELWHTRLTTASSAFGPDKASKIRAIWSPDYPDGLDEPIPFRTSLTPMDRRMLVTLMADYGAQRLDLDAPYVPRSSKARRLHLSSLGGLLDAEGSWDPRPQGTDIEQWRHLATLGRDHYVRVVYVGFLCDVGHAAALVKVTERKFESLGKSNHRIAVLRQRYFIVVRERVKEYKPGDHVFQGHNFPFTKVEILTRVTPSLLAPEDPACALQEVDGYKIFETITVDKTNVSITPRMAFWPMLGTGSGSKDFQFEIAATDITGRRVIFSRPLLFVGQLANQHKAEQVRMAYNAPATVSRRGTNLSGSTVCYAPFDPGDKGDPRLPTENLTFTAGALRDGLHYAVAPNFYPEIAKARVGIPALQKILGRSDAMVSVSYPSIYKQHGFGDPAQNTGKVFLQLVDQVHPLNFGGGTAAKSDALGALAAPQMSILGLSRTMGPVGAKEPTDPSDPQQFETALSNAIAGKFDPTDFFKGATILGGIDLSAILDVVTGLAGAGVPKLLSRELPDAIEASFTWDAEIKRADPTNVLIPRADSQKPVTKLTMSALQRTPLDDPANVTSNASADLNNFKVNLFGFVIVWFELLRFRTKNGQKPDVTVELRQGDDAVQFGGPLEFVNTLRELIPSGGFSDPPALTVTPSGITASYSLTLPTVGVGVFSVSNLSLGAGFNLPFDATPSSVQFHFSEREHPFSVTVSLFGGGGFFAIGVSAKGVQEIEAAIEFGAGVSIDLGVASGSVEVKAGVYFHWLEGTPGKGTVELTGYVRLHGELSVLGLISASLTFNLSLGYLKENGESRVCGEATLTIEVEVLFFSAEVSISCRREFGGSPSDPKFIALMPDAETWAEYCDAFAQETV